jgi:DoxX-like family
MALNSPNVYRGLAVFQVADAAISAVPVAPVTAALDAVKLAPAWRPVLPVVNGLSAIGLASVGRFPALARLTTLMLTVYFVLAVGFHVRARDWGPGLLAASSFGVLYAILTARGPASRPS